MGNEISILKIMIKDHCKIEELIDNLDKKNKLDYESMREAFNKFEWELENISLLKKKQFLHHITQKILLKAIKCYQS